MDETQRILIARLVERIESHPLTLHRRNSYLDQYARLRKDLLFSAPEDCDCGLDALLIEARAYIH